MTEAILDEKAVIYRVGDKAYPRVTTILKSCGFIDYSNVPERNIEFGMDRGRKAHKALEMWDLGVLNEDSLDERLAPYLKAYKQFRQDTQFLPEMIEQPLFSEAYGYAGTPDRVGDINGHVTVVDIKSGSPEPWHGLQLEAYRHLLGQCADRVAVYLRPTGKYRLEYYKDLNDWPIFSAALSCYNWKMAHGGTT